MSDTVVARGREFVGLLTAEKISEFVMIASAAAPVMPRSDGRSVGAVLRGDLWPDQQHWKPRRPDDLLGDAAGDETLQRSPPMRGHRDEIDGVPVSVADDRSRRTAVGKNGSLHRHARCCFAEWLPPARAPGP